MSGFRICLTLISVLLCSLDVNCFNFDARLPIIKRGGHGTYFGFSVAEHIISQDKASVSLEDSWLLIGAPLDQNAQPNTNRSGALWQCPLTTLHTDCRQVITDGKRDIDNDNLIPPQKDELKDGQWLGVTVRTQGQGGKVLVCAHRYIRQAPDYRWGRGLCYTLTNQLELDEAVEPCKGRPTDRAHEQYGYCQAGTSGLLMEDNAVIGAPGPYTWRGAIYVQEVSDDFLGRDKTMYYSPHIDDQSPVDKYSYLGMAVTAANFFGNGIVYAAGAPRSNGTGQVILFTKKTAVTTMSTHMVLTGDMYTSNFGYELATADVNGDRLPDLIVGAPNYFDKTQGGAIYVYLNSKSPCTLTCSPPLKITGQPESRYGIAITNLGDINKDGYDDIAVGAPYDGQGAIYVYLGSKNGTIPEPSQEDTKDIQTAISMRLSYSIVQEAPKSLKPGSPLPRMDNYPILNQQQADKVFQATFLKDCGENDICESQLNIDANLDLPKSRSKDKLDTNRYDLMLGEYREIQLNVTVDNVLESAYEAELHIVHAPALSYIATVKGRCERFPEKMLVVCPLGNPLRRNRSVNILLRFEPLREVDDVSEVKFSLKAVTTSNIVEPQNEVILVANVIRKANLKLRGLWNSTLVEDYPRVKAVHIASHAKLFIPNPTVVVTSQPFDTQASAVTIAKPGGSIEQQATEAVPLWMILVAVVAGLLLLLLIAILFWKCGFFKRTRPDPTLSGNLEKHTDDFHDY
ncbi:unnamed protein product [Nesidiocoris tenuis]|uniref:Integrin alpha second immunoglobulin-like domain-containing protein n=1 Tax=Nesidiocoris tenuis TaxID=355587 RepID=A0A6H5HJL3_9HEMI|nr:unnamed protein product [Nesidiocoris tenuis]